MRVRHLRVPAITVADALTKFSDVNKSTVCDFLLEISYFKPDLDVFFNLQKQTRTPRSPEELPSLPLHSRVNGILLFKGQVVSCPGDNPVKEDK